MRAEGLVFVFKLALFSSNEACRDAYYASEAYMNGTELLFDWARRNDPSLADRSSAFLEGFDKWLVDGRTTGMIVRVRSTAGVEARSVLEARYRAFPSTILDYDKAPP